MDSHLSFGPLPVEEPFNFDVLYAHPGKLRRQTRSQRRIAIIGGGIAGLVAGYELSKLKHQVVIFESANRVGGRILTHHFPDGVHGELGAMRIPANHLCTRHYVKEFGLETRQFVNQNNAGRYCLRNRRSQLCQWQLVAEGYELEAQEVKDPLKLYEDKMFRAMVGLTSEDKWQMFSNNLQSDRLRQYDDLTLRQFLRRWLSQEAVQYVGHATGMIKYEKAAFLETLIDYFGLFRVDQYEIVAGMDALPTAAASKLEQANAEIRLNCCVQRVEITPEKKVNIGFRNADGTPGTEVFDAAICTLPPPVLAKVRFSPPPPPRQIESWRGVSFASSSKTLMLCKERPWEYEEEIYGGGSFTDMPNQQTWYPNDNAKPTGQMQVIGFTGDDPDPNSSSPAGRYSSAPSSYIAKDPDVSHSPGSLTAAYMWEAGSRRFAAMSEDDRTDMAMFCVRQHHPNIEAHIEEVVHHCWDAQTSPGEGAFAYFGPGEHQRFQPWMGAPYPQAEPLVYFAGEHLAVAHAWIQGAIQSALVAAQCVA